MKIAFYGLVGLGTSCLKKLVESGFEVTAVVTEKSEDNRIIEQKINSVQNIHKNALREYMQYNKILDICRERGISVFTPESNDCLIETSKIITDKGADVMIVCSYGKKIPAAVFGSYKLAVNIHPGLLPLNAGPAPVQWSIRKNEITTGVTAHILTEELDAGDIVNSMEIPIDSSDTSASLNYKITEIYAPEVLIRTLISFQMNRMNFHPQDTSLRVLNPKYSLEHSCIDFERDTAEEIILKVRAGNYYQPAHFNFNEKTIIVWDAAVSNQKFDINPGEAAGISSEGFLILQTADKAIEIRRVQMNDNFSPEIIPERLLKLL